jgi:hypothetical protein
MRLEDWADLADALIRPALPVLGIAALVKYIWS